MSTTDVRSSESSDVRVKNVDLTFEAVVIPIADVGRAKEFYASPGIGW